MMFFENKDKPFNKPLEWHIGEPMPIIDMRRVVITVDCDELDWLIEKMKETRIKK